MIGGFFSKSDTESSQRQSGSQGREIAAATPQEQALRDLNFELAKTQVAQAQTAGKELDQGVSQGPQNQQLLDLAIQRLLASMTSGAPLLSGPENEQLSTIYGTASKQADEDLRRFGESIAASRGMSTGDSPIGNELIRQRARVGETLGANRAQSTLDLSSANRNFAATLAQFQQGLQQQAFANRLALAGMQAPSYNFANSLFGERLAAAPVQFSQRGQGSAATTAWGGQGSASYNPNAANGTGAWGGSFTR